ncbi:MAG: RNA-guided pseudouridylation complex pseudouridine synthase subunit Cbf5, partial [Methanomicrobium sp.]|nr:RNA-guided pseudouridylation complex pseudouridine synthase subunit Cbf5 [Methanomicrobium sp.]
MSEFAEDPEIKELLECGIIAVDKPQGPSSHQVTAWVKEILGGEVRIGHGGTLDPMVSGVLIVMLGRAVRLAPVILKHRKEYIAVLRLHGDVAEEDVLRIAEEFRGKVYQRPPRKSAVRRQLRIRTIYNIDILDFSGRLVLMRVSCEAGTYIRSLCTHMALALGVGGQMEELRRSRSGSLGLPDTCTLQDLKDAYVFASEGNPEELKSMILPVERLISEIPVVKIRDSAVEAVCSGAVLAGVGVTARESYRRDALVAVITEKNELVCIGKALVSSEEYKPGDTGLVVAPEAVVMKRGTYEKGWTKHEYKADEPIKTDNQTDITKETEEMAKYQKSEKPVKSAKKSDKREYSGKKADHHKSERPNRTPGQANKTYNSDRKTEYSNSDRPARTLRPARQAERPYNPDRKTEYSNSERQNRTPGQSKRPYNSDRKTEYSNSDRPNRPPRQAGKTYNSDRKTEYSNSDRPNRPPRQAGKTYNSDRKTEYSNSD